MPFPLALVAAVGALLSRRTEPAKVSEQKGASKKAQAKVSEQSRKAQAKVTAEASSEQKGASQGNSGSKAFCKLFF